MSKQWDQYKDIITNMYENHNLATVRQRMNDQYGFHASLRAYRNHLGRWGIKTAKDSGSRYSSDSASQLEEEIDDGQREAKATPISFQYIEADKKEMGHLEDFGQIKHGKTGGHAAQDEFKTIEPVLNPASKWATRARLTSYWRRIVRLKFAEGFLMYSPIPIIYHIRLYDSSQSRNGRKELLPEQE